MQFLDLSQNAIDKKSVEYIAGALAQMPEQGLASLKLDDCQLKPLSLEALGKILKTLRMIIVTSAISQHTL